ncbi:MAG: hypothetical protein ACRC1F_03080 [Metamycoplasmataceae bacterium]
MKSTRQYTCIRRMNKSGDKIWVVIENDKFFYRIFKTQTAAISYFKQLKTPAQMIVQQATGDKFSRMVFTFEEMARKGLTTSSKSIPTKAVKNSDKIFDEKELKKNIETKKNSKSKPVKKPIEKKVTKPAVKKPVEKKVTKPAVKKQAVKKPIEKKVTKSSKAKNTKNKSTKKPIENETKKPIKAKVAKAVAIQRPKEQIREKQKDNKILEPKLANQDSVLARNLYVEKDTSMNLSTGELISTKEYSNLYQNNPEEIQNTRTINLMSELAKLDEARIQEFEKQDTLNLSIIDEILQRKAVVENSWDENTNNSNNKDIVDNSIKNTIYVKEEIEKPIIINSTKIDFNEELQKKTSTIENIIDQRVDEFNVKGVDYGRIKEYSDFEKTQIQDFKNESLEKEDASAKISSKKTSDTNEKNGDKNGKFWVVTILTSLFLMAAVTAIILWFLPPVL